MNYLYIDTEYSSFYSHDKNKTGELLQLAAVPVVNGIQQESFNEFCRPLTDVWSIEAERVHKIAKNQALSAQHPEDMAKKFLEFLTKYDCFFQPSGFNCSGDELYINRLIADYKIILPYRKYVNYKWEDVLPKVKDKKDIKLKSYTLESVKKFFKIESVGHDALNDADATRQIDELLRSMYQSFSPEQLKYSKMSNVEKRQVYTASDYLMVNPEGSIYISEKATKNKEALKFILQEIWSTFLENK